MGHGDDRERVSRRGSQDETVFTPRGGGGARSIHDRLGDRATMASPPRKRTTSIDEDNGPKRRRLSATNVKPTEDDPKMLQRSRRMFGALMGHLGRAKKQLAQDSDFLQKQDRLLSAAEAKEKQHRQVVEQRTARRKIESQIASHKRDAMDKIAKLERKHALSITSERHQARFLQTVSPIPIFYLPARHTKETQALVDASMEAIEEKIQAERREIDAKKRDIEAESQRKVVALEAELTRLDGAKPADGNNDKEDADTASSPRDTGSPSANDVEQAEDVSNPPDNDATPPTEADANDGEEEPQTSLERASEQAAPLSPPKEASSPVKKPSSPVKKPSSPVKKPSSPAKKAAPSSPPKEPLSPEKVSPSAVKTPTSPATKPSSLSAVQAAAHDTEAIETKREVPDASSDDEAKAASVDADSAKTETTAAPVVPSIIPSKLKVVELRQQLKDRGLDTKGLKDDLVKRLEQALAN